MDYNLYLGKKAHQVWSGDTVTPAQSFFMTQAAPIQFSSGSVRSGKTIAIAQRVIAHCLVFPGARAGVFRHHLSDMKNSTLISFLELIDPSWVASFDLKELIIVLKNGSQLLFKQAADVDSLGSMEFSVIAVDETVQISFAVLNQLVGRLSVRVHRPSNYDELSLAWQQFVDMQLDFNTILLVCNPRGRDHYLYKNFIDDESRPENCLFQTTSTIENTALQPSYVVNNILTALKPGHSFKAADIEQWVLDIRSGKRLLGSISKYLTVEGRRLFLGEWVNSDKAIFSGFDPTLSSTNDASRVFGTSDQPVSYDDVIAAVDFGYAHPRVVVLGVTLNGDDYPSYCILDYWAGVKRTTDSTLERAYKLCEHYQASLIYLPPDDPGAIQQFVTRFQGCTSVVKAKNSVLAGITTVQHAFNNGRVLVYNNDSRHYQVLEEELTGYSWEEDRNGNAIDKPVKSADHFPDALRYAIFSYQYGKNFGPIHSEPEELSFGGMRIQVHSEVEGFNLSQYR